MEYMQRKCLFCYKLQSIRPSARKLMWKIKNPWYGKTAHIKEKQTKQNFLPGGKMTHFVYVGKR